MSDDLNLTGYTAAHRVRESDENGHIDTTGKRQKKWRGWYHVCVIKPDGTKVRSHRKRIIGLCSEMSKNQAREEHRAWVKRFHQQPAADSSRSKIADLCDDFIELRKKSWEEESTLPTNRSVFAIIKAALGERQVASVTAEQLKHFIDSLPERKWLTPTGKRKTGTSISYIKKIITQLRSIFDLAVERDLITKNPTRSKAVKLDMPIGVSKPKKPVFPPGRFPALIAELSTRDRLIVWIAAVSALRPNELFPVRAKNVGPRWIFIETAFSRRRKHKDTKTGTARYVSMPPQLARDVHQWIADNGIQPNDYLFVNEVGKPIARQNFLNRRLQPAAKRAGIEISVDFRILRRTFSTLARALGVDVTDIQHQLGHEEPDMTLKEYIQPVDETRDRAAERVENVLLGLEKIPDLSLRSRRLQ